MIFLLVSQALQIWVNSTLQKFRGCKMTEKWSKTSHRKMKEMQLFMGERYPPDINCRGIENLPYLFENRCLTTLERGETLIAYCSV